MFKTYGNMMFPSTLTAFSPKSGSKTSCLNLAMPVEFISALFEARCCDLGKVETVAGVLKVGYNTPQAP